MRHAYAFIYAIPTVYTMKTGGDPTWLVPAGFICLLFSLASRPTKPL